MRFIACDLIFCVSSIRFLFICCFVYVCDPFVAAVTNRQDANALIILHKSWSSIPSWDTSTDPCDDEWLGVQCDRSTNTRVVELILINRQLNGVLSPAIGNLTSLTDLDLSSNPKLGGGLPKEIGKLSNLRKFFAQFCNFSGSIPSEIEGMANLQYLGLTRNSLTGPLPSSIGLLANLVWFDLSSNFLNGSLPISTSSATGSGLDNLTNVQHIHLQNNSFSGSIPSALFKSATSLLHLLLHHNSFTGTIDETIGDLVNVNIVRFDFNRLNGSIPSTVSNMQNLTTLELNNNALTGQLPDFSSNKKLQMLKLGNNPFEASPLPAWITNLTNLCLLSLESTNLIGSIPFDLFELQRLSNVSLGSNNLSGTLNLTAASSTLLMVDVTNNNISALDRGTYAQELLLDGNAYCNTDTNICTDIQSATSPAPSPTAATAVSTCKNQCQALYAINRKVSGNCQCDRPVFGSVTFIATEIPILTDYYVSLIEQQLTDRGLNKYLSVYNLTFNVSQVVVDVLSSNTVTISVFPPSGQTLWSPNEASLIAYVIKSQDVQFSVIGPLTCEFNGEPYDNPGITGTPLSTGAIIGIGVGVAALVVVTVGIAIFAARQNRRAQKAERLNKPFAAWIAGSKGDNPDIPQLKGAHWFSLAEVRKCTNDFSHTNEIGEGGYGKVYKGCLLSGERVAIKKAGVDSMQGAMEFKNEIELLSRVHHRNLVGLIGFCFEGGEQMLVYEYMPNGTLKDCLTGKSGIRMDWERRIAFALGSARGIAYLHTEADPPIVHRDIKSSNILLDETLAPKVADFGISQLVRDNDGTEDIKGTPGYLDPDYFMTKHYTLKSDVYSFGVILLELITGRQPIQGGKYVVREVRMALERGGMASVLQFLVDPNLTHYPKEAMEKLIELSLRCVEDKSDHRPSMGQLVKELESLMQEPPMAMETEMGRARQLPRRSFEYSGSYGTSSISGAFSGDVLLPYQPVILPRD